MHLKRSVASITGRQPLSILVWKLPTLVVNKILVAPIYKIATIQNINYLSMIYTKNDVIIAGLRVLSQCCPEPDMIPNKFQRKRQACIWNAMTQYCFNLNDVILTELLTSMGSKCLSYLACDVFCHISVQI